MSEEMLAKALHQAAQVSSLNTLAREIHAWAMRMGFYDPCPECHGNGTDPSGGKRPCAVCAGRGSAVDEARLNKHLLHINGEVDEIFQLTRDHSLDALRGTENARTDDTPYVPVTDKHCPDHPAIAVELADVLIRTLDCAAWLGLDVGRAVLAKMAYNATRAHRHGRRH